MTIIEQIKAEIERLKGIGGIVPLDNREQKTGYESALIDIEIFLDSLESEKPTQEGLEEEIIKCWQAWVSPSNKQSVEGVFPLSEFVFYARHFAEWQKEQLLKDAEECELYWDGDFLAIDLNMAALGYSERDKVRVIILPKDNDETEIQK